MFFLFCFLQPEKGSDLTRVGPALKYARGSVCVCSDVNECDTQLVLCDANADCVDQFGSHSCRCRPGFQDKTRQGSGGTVDAKAAG